MRRLDQDPDDGSRWGGDRRGSPHPGPAAGPYPGPLPGLYISRAARPPRRPAAGRHARSRPPRVRAAVMATLLVAAAAALIGSYRFVSGVEAVLAGRFVGGVLHQHTLALRDQAVVVLHAADPREIGLPITAQCTSTFLIAPMVLTAAVLLWLRPQQFRRVLVGLAVTTVLLFLTNQLRILGLAALIDGVGFKGGYYWGHTILGSMVSVVGGGASLLAFVYWTLVRGRAARGTPRLSEVDGSR